MSLTTCDGPTTPWHIHAYTCTTVHAAAVRKYLTPYVVDFFVSQARPNPCNRRSPTGIAVPVCSHVAAGHKHVRAGPQSD